MIFLPNFTIFAKTLFIRYMEGDKKENYLISKEDVLNSYREYYKNSKEERELPNIYTKNNTSNRFILQLEKDLDNFLGEGNYPKKQTLGDIFYIKNYVIKEKYEKGFRLYIKQVSRVLKVRELKKELIKLISTEDGKLETLRETPNKFLEELEFVIRNTIDIEDELTLGNDLNILFTDESKHYIIKESSVEDVRKYIVEVQNNEDKQQEGIPCKFKFLKIYIKIVIVFFFLIFILFFGFRILNYLQTHIFTVFHPHDTSYKIMILPFEDECTYDGSLQNVGRVIEKRLLKISKSDSLNINVRYITDFVSKRTKKDENWYEYYKRVMIENNADQIIYGSTREENCSFSKEDEVCLNYITNPKGNIKFEKTNNTFVPAPLHEISSGKLQGNIDFIISLNAARAARFSDPLKEIKYLNKILESETSSYQEKIRARFERASVYDKIFWIPEAKKDFRYVKDNDSIDVLDPFEKINCKIGLGEDYLQDVENILRNEPKNPNALFFKALYFTEIKDSVSIKDLNKAINYSCCKSTYISVCDLFGNWFLSKKRYNEALEYFDKALKKNKRIYVIRLSRGISNFYLSNFSEAMNDFEKAIKIGGETIDAKLWKGIIFLKLKKTEEAKKEFEKIVNNHKNKFDGQNQVIEGLMHFGFPNYAKKIISEYIENNSFSPIHSQINKLVYRMDCNMILGLEKEVKIDSIKINQLDSQYFRIRDSLYQNDIIQSGIKHNEEL